MTKSSNFFILIKFVRIFLILCIFSCFVYAEPEQRVGPDPWSLIIYRPDNNGDINTVRCWLKLEDAETGEDVTYSKAKATYEWVSIPNVKNEYMKSWYLSGGMAMHLILAPGKYRISVCTPKDRTDFFECENKGDWLSNVFEYDTANPTNVIFVVPTVNENGFYNGGWHIDYRAPRYYKFTRPKIKPLTTD
ncbi:MAG: hypothetical protein J6T84_04410 [Spirochaetaceae bacterium]|nr:hypothetical protein [Spirochaetaceae bacterium]